MGSGQFTARLEIHHYFAPRPPSLVIPSYISHGNGKYSCVGRTTRTLRPRADLTTRSRTNIKPFSAWPYHHIERTFTRTTTRRVIPVKSSPIYTPGTSSRALRAAFRSRGPCDLISGRRSLTVVKFPLCLSLSLSLFLSVRNTRSRRRVVG